MGSDKALALLEKHLGGDAITALEHAGGDKALALLEKVLANCNDGYVRSGAVRSLVGCGDKALPLIEKMLSDPNESVRLEARAALLCATAEKSK
jgi:HEAT repeat protein